MALFRRGLKHLYGAQTLNPKPHHMTLFQKPLWHLNPKTLNIMIWPFLEEASKP